MEQLIDSPHIWAPVVSLLLRRCSSLHPDFMRMASLHNSSKVGTHMKCTDALHANLGRHGSQMDEQCYSTWLQLISKIFVDVSKNPLAGKATDLATLWLLRFLSEFAAAWPQHCQHSALSASLSVGKPSFLKAAKRTEWQVRCLTLLPLYLLVSTKSNVYVPCQNSTMQSLILFPFTSGDLGCTCAVAIPE